MKAVRRSGKKPSELSAEVTLYPQVLVNARVSNEGKESYKNDEEIRGAISAIEDKMAGEGRVLIRPSGTEPLVRVMIEGKNEKEIGKMAQELADKISSRYC